LSKTSITSSDQSVSRSISTNKILTESLFHHKFRRNFDLKFSQNYVAISITNGSLFGIEYVGFSLFLFTFVGKECNIVSIVKRSKESTKEENKATGDRQSGRIMTAGGHL